MSYKTLFILLGLFTWACSSSSQGQQLSPQAELKSEIDSLEHWLLTHAEEPLDFDKAKALISKSLTYQKNYSEDQWSPVYLFRAAEVCVGIKAYPQAIQYFAKMYTAYPEHEKAPSALFLQAFTLENNLRDVDAAKSYYQLFLQKHPSNAMAKEVELILKNINKSPEDLIREFQKQ